MRVEWPGRDYTSPPRGYLYLVFQVCTAGSLLFLQMSIYLECVCDPNRWCSDIFIQDERDVIDLLSKCGQDYTSRDSYYYKISSRRMRAKEVGKKSALFC